MKSEIQDQVWRVSHAYVCSLLEIYRDHGFWMTGYKSWDIIKWNTYGNVLISECAIRKFLCYPDLHKTSKASKFGGQGNSRCFVAEHMYPTKSLQELTLIEWKCRIPDLEEFKNFVKKYNRLCYVWHEEDRFMNENQLKSSIPENSDRYDVTARYKSCNIKPYETSFVSGIKLFNKLEQSRLANKSFERIISEISPS